MAKEKVNETELNPTTKQEETKAIEIDANQINQALIVALHERDELINKLQEELKNKNKEIEGLKNTEKPVPCALEEVRSPKKEEIYYYLTHKLDFIKVKIKHLKELKKEFPEIEEAYNDELISIYSANVRCLVMLLMDLEEERL